MDAVRQLILDRVPNLAEMSRKIGRNHAYLQQFVHRNVPLKLPEDARAALALELGIPENFLRQDAEHNTATLVNTPTKGEGTGARSKQLPQAPNELEIPGAQLIGDRDLPVFATAEGGKGALIVSSEAVDWVVRPDPLLRVRDGYGMIVTGDSMAPEHRSGSTALVNPHLPPRAGDTCVFRSHADDGTVLAIIKELRRFTDDTWYVRQHQPRKDFTLKRTEWQVCHVTVGNYKRR